MDQPVLRPHLGERAEPAGIVSNDWLVVGSAPGTPEGGAAKRSENGLVISFVATLASAWVLQFAVLMAVCTWVFAWMQDAFQFVQMRETLLSGWFVASLGARLYLASSGVVVDLEPPMRVTWNHRVYVMFMGSWIFVPMVVRDISSWLAP